MSSMHPNERSHPTLQLQPRRTTSFRRYNITVHTSPSQAAYLPSWMEKVQKTRQEMIDNLNSARLREQLYLNRHRCDSRGSRHSTSSSLGSPRMLKFLQAATIDGSTAEHESLEQQYQELRNKMFPPKSREKVPDLPDPKPSEDDKQKKKTKTKRTRFKLKEDTNHSYRPRARDVSDSASSAPSTGRTYHHVQVPVSDLLASDALGSDHFLKHLNCVKQLARRYRRGNRRHRHIGEPLNVQDS
ncbi:uncharacterized protein LOC110455124 [Mizuhopecten yessoensis]|uniref:Uncharacterized protein n=1 Tax=Mizuhopecten yessoensis TaxID=6573 RepID=A0A210QDP0_MIZYE|nr:uncharacterized protein LOC110455124 [Mizuhopecten yessoensis]OWF46855.1 hypothetical protein KP79_PYT07098 [Mizuhopecten yessoensis]